MALASLFSYIIQNRVFCSSYSCLIYVSCLKLLLIVFWFAICHLQILVTISSSLKNEADTEKYKDLRALLQLLASLCSKDFVISLIPFLFFSLFLFPLSEASARMERRGSKVGLGSGVIRCKRKDGRGGVEIRIKENNFLCLLEQILYLLFLPFSPLCILTLQSYGLKKNIFAG